MIAACVATVARKSLIEDLPRAKGCGADYSFRLGDISVQLRLCKQVQNAGLLELPYYSVKITTALNSDHLDEIVYLRVQFMIYRWQN
jgi:hypothetical protein